MRILIVGSKGFIGFHAEQFFLCKGFDVFSCDVIVDYGKINYSVIDSTNADFHTLFQANRFDICLNCSGAASVQDSIINPLRDFNLNVCNVFKILDAIRLYQPKCKFLNLSSAAVYGNPKSIPIKESDDLNPISPYGIHKLQAEQICEEFYNLFDVKTCSLRIFSAYGAGLKKQIFWDLYQKLKISNQVELYGTGSETRDFIYVSDILQAINCVITNSEFCNDKINVANEVESKIMDVAENFAALFPDTKRIVFNNIVKEGDPLNWKADTTLLKSLGYFPTIDLKEGIKKYFDWVSTY